MYAFTEGTYEKLQGKTVFSENEIKELIKQGELVETEYEGNTKSTNGEIRISILYPDVPYFEVNVIPVKNKTYLETKQNIDRFIDKLRDS